MLNTKHITNSEEETIKLGKEFASKVNAGDILYFYGDLGSGKTEFIKGICEYFKVVDIVTSPTFTIMNKYVGEKKGNEIAIFHIDLYRIEKEKELDEIGFEDCLFENNSIKLFNRIGISPSEIMDCLFVIRF